MIPNTLDLTRYTARCLCGGTLLLRQYTIETRMQPSPTYWQIPIQPTNWPMPMDLPVDLPDPESHLTYDCQRCLVTVDLIIAGTVSDGTQVTDLLLGGSPKGLTLRSYKTRIASVPPVISPDELQKLLAASTITVEEARRLLTSLNVDVAPDPPSPPEKVIDGCVIGYRAWKIRDWSLRGTGSSRTWQVTEDGVQEASCTYGNHTAPAEGCRCGIYALARFDARTVWWDDADVLGAVQAWSAEDADGESNFFIYETGFRTQYAKIVLLATSAEYPRSKNAAIRALAAEHGADTCERQHLEDAAKEHGSLLSDEVLAWAAS